MTSQPLALQTGKRLHHDCVPQCQLVLHDDVNDGVELVVRQKNLMAAMVGRYLLDARTFVRLQPVSRRRWGIGIVRTRSLFSLAFVGIEQRLCAPAPRARRHGRKRVRLVGLDDRDGSTPV
jgi:hypothetical protein